MTNILILILIIKFNMNRNKINQTLTIIFITRIKKIYIKISKENNIKREDAYINREKSKKTNQVFKFACLLHSLIIRIEIYD